MLIFLLYGGYSEDGLGSGTFIKATESKEEALMHYKDVKSDPYSVGSVKVLTENSFSRIFTESEEVSISVRRLKREVVSKCMTQSQLIHLETLAQIVSGNIIALVILYFYGMSLTQSLSLQVVFFITSYIRSYFIY